jgi:retron-type reverse transcriptase
MALHAKAKTEAGYRFYTLYDKIYREDILAHAYAQCRSNKGAPGVDGQDFSDVEAYGVERWLGELAIALKEETYRPDPIRRVFIPKPNGKLRPLGISTLRDRVCMTAAMLVLDPIFEADLPNEQYAYRAGRNAQQAVIDAEEKLYRGHLDVVDADLSDYFGSIPHAELMRSLARRIVDSRVLHLIKMWLECAVEETDDQGRKKRTTEAKHSGRGIPQGSPITPRTQKVTFSLNASLRAGVARRFLICVSRGNMFTTDGQIEQSGQGAAVERGTSSTRAQRCAIRGCADSIAQVRLIAASSISIPRRSGAARSSSRDNRGNRAGHSQAPAQYGSFITHACRTQWLDYWHARHTSAGRVFRRAKKAWLSGVQDAPHLKSTSTIRLIDCSSRSLRKPMTFWCLDGNA